MIQLESLPIILTGLGIIISILYYTNTHTHLYMHIKESIALRFIRKNIRKIKNHHYSNPNISIYKSFTITINETVQDYYQRKQMKSLVLDILQRYELKPDNVSYIGESVNTVFSLEAKGSKYIIRINPPDHRSLSELKAEVSWLLALRKDIGLWVPEPIPAKDGSYIQKTSSTKRHPSRQILLFKWLNGTPLYDNLSETTMEQAGSFIARLHNHSKQFKLPDGISRQQNNWDKTWVWMDENYIHPQYLTRDDYNLCVNTSKEVLTKIKEFTNDVYYGLIHFDLHPWNLLLHQGEIQAIDFDECQFAPFLFDLAVPLSYLTERPDYQRIKSGFLKGYSKERPLPPDYVSGIELFITVCHLNMIAWILSWPTPSKMKFGPKFLENSLSQIKKYNS